MMFDLTGELKQYQRMLFAAGSQFKRHLCGLSQGSHYALCFNQCLERFQLNPRLYIDYFCSKAPKYAGVEVEDVQAD